MKVFDASSSGLSSPVFQALGRFWKDWLRDFLILNLAIIFLPLGGILIAPFLRAFLVFRSARTYILVGVLWSAWLLFFESTAKALAPFVILYFSLVIFRILEIFFVKSDAYRLIFGTALVSQLLLEFGAWLRWDKSYTSVVLDTLAKSFESALPSWLQFQELWIIHFFRPLMVLSLLIFLGFSIMLDVKLAWAFGWLLKRDKSPLIIRYPNFTRFSLKDYWIWVLISGLMGVMWSPEPYKFWFLEPLVISLGLFGIQGLAVFEFFLNHWRAGLWLRAMLYVLLFGHLIWLVVLVGLSDYWLVWRHRFKKSKN